MSETVSNRSLGEILKKVERSELLKLIDVAAASDNLTMLEAIAKRDSKIFKITEKKKSTATTESDNSNNQIPFVVCKFASLGTMEFFKKFGHDFAQREPKTGNTCMHLAAIYGNIPVG